MIMGLFTSLITRMELLLSCFRQEPLEFDNEPQLTRPEDPRSYIPGSLSPTLSKSSTSRVMANATRPCRYIYIGETLTRMR